MSDHFTETSSQGFFSRITNSLAGLIIQAIVGLKDAASQVVEAEASGPSPANDNRLAHVVGAATARSPIQDADVGITFADQVGVARTAEMYQWKEDKKQETQDNLGGGQTTTTTYDYTREWSDDAINSSEFKHPENHQNPEMPFRNKRFAASDAKLGGWTLDADTLGKVDYSQMLEPDAPAGWTRSGENYYRGDAAAPKVGDMRVRYVGLPSGRILLQGRRTSSIQRLFGNAAAVPCRHGREARDSQLAGIPSIRLTRVASRSSQLHYPRAHSETSFHAHA